MFIKLNKIDLSNDSLKAVHVAVDAIRGFAFVPQTASVVQHTLLEVAGVVGYSSFPVMEAPEEIIELCNKGQLEADRKLFDSRAGAILLCADVLVERLIAAKPAPQPQPQPQPVKKPSSRR